MREAVLEKLKGGLVVSCQALKSEPLHSSYIMSRMAYAAYLGGAVGIRANTVEDITEIKKTVDLPIIGIIKAEYEDSEVYITPTLKEVQALVECGVDIIAIDATNRIRPNGATLDEFFKKVRALYPDQLFMADCSNYEEGIHAAEIGFDMIGTTLHGYTDYTKGVSLPNYDLVNALVRDCGKPVIGEGGIWSPQELKAVMDCGVLTAVVGTAITRPMDITKKYVEVLKA